MSEHINDKNVQIRISAILGLGLAYAGTAREDIRDLLLPLVSDLGLSSEIFGTAALALGMIFVGSTDGDITSTILQTMMEREDAILKETFSRFLGLGLGLLYLGKQLAAEATLETLKVIENPLGKQASVMVEMCAYAATGNVLKMQQMLHLCNDHLDNEKQDDTFQAFAVIALALISAGEDIGSVMVLRTFNHLVS